MQFQDLNSFFCDRVYLYSDVIFEIEFLMNCKRQQDKERATPKKLQTICTLISIIRAKIREELY